MRWGNMSKANFEKSYSYKIFFYILVLALPVVLMTLVVISAPVSAVSPLSPDPSRFLFFVLYFLPGLILARNVTQSWRKTLGIGIAYAFLSPAYYTYAVDYACKIMDSCVQI